MTPATATHVAQGRYKPFYYRKKPADAPREWGFFYSGWEYYDTYTNQWVKSYAPHKNMRAL